MRPRLFETMLGDFPNLDPLDDTPIPPEPEAEPQWWWWDSVDQDVDSIEHPDHLAQDGVGTLEDDGLRIEASFFSASGWPVRVYVGHYDDPPDRYYLLIAAQAPSYGIAVSAMREAAADGAFAMWVPYIGRNAR